MPRPTFPEFTEFHVYGSRGEHAQPIDVTETLPAAELICAQELDRHPREYHVIAKLMDGTCVECHSVSP